MSATNRLIDKVLENFKANEHMANSPGYTRAQLRPHEVELGALAQAADRERGEDTVLVYVRPEDFEGMGGDKACGYLVDHIMSQLTPEQQAIFQDK